MLIASSIRLVDCVTRYHNNYTALGADELLPLFAFLLIRAEIAHAVALQQFMELFILSPEVQGVAGYFAASYQAALDIVRNHTTD